MPAAFETISVMLHFGKEIIMLTTLRFAFVAATAFFLLLIAKPVHAGPASEVPVRWSELPPVLAGRQVSIRLTGGATVEGKYSSLEPDALSIQVIETSDRLKYPKGAIRLARPEITQITVKRQKGWKGRTIGLAAGGGIAAVVTVSFGAMAKNEVGGWSAMAAGFAAGVSGTAIGVGYLVGWLIDSSRFRPEQVVRILPEAGSR
jgi:hypothetical protein